MGYLHIPNLFKDQTILEFKHLYAMEKLHGTSAHISYIPGHPDYNGGGLKFYSGEQAQNFIKLMQQYELLKPLNGMPALTIYGEFYGGKIQKQSKRYGKKERFCAFEVKIGESWLSVPQAHEIVSKLGLEFVDYEFIPAEIDEINSLRDKPSTQSLRNGVEEIQIREGIVLRPPIEVMLNNGDRIIAKHKRDEFRETKTPRSIGQILTLSNGNMVASEWVTENRLNHILSITGAIDISHTPIVVRAMTDDVIREGKGEVEDNRDNRQAIGKAAANLFKKSLHNTIHGD